MARYKIQKTDLLHNGKLFLEGSEIELTEENAKKLANYLVPVAGKRTNTPKNTSKTGKNSKAETKTTPEQTTTEKQNEETK